MKEHLAFLATCDLVGHVRGRALDSKNLFENKKSVGWVPANLALTSFGLIASPDPFGSYGDLRLLPIEETHVEMRSGDDGRRSLDFYLSNIVNMDGSPWNCDPRNQLEKALKTLKKNHDIEVMASFEHEFLLLETPQQSNKPFSFETFRTYENFLATLYSQAEKMGLEPENILPEYGAQQFEVTLKPTNALQAADRAIILRELVRDLAKRFGYRASFVPIPNIDSVGNGVHIHLSLWRDGRPLTYDEKGEGLLSTVASQALNGILEHVGAILSWSAPSQISFLRLQPHRWSSGMREVAMQNREAIVRLCKPHTFSGVKVEQAFNFEYRAADATANPWLSLASIIYAMNDGLDSGKLLDRVLDGDLDSRQDLKPLPRSLEEAVLEFKGDNSAQGWFDEKLIATHVLIRDEEKKILSDHSDDEKCRRYSDVY